MEVACKAFNNFGSDPTPDRMTGKKITKSDPQLQQPQHFSGTLILGPLLLFWGGYLILAGLNLLPITTEILLSFKWETFLDRLLPKSFNWVILIFGCFVLLVSLIIFIKGIRSWLNKRKRIALAKLYRRPWFSDYPWNPKGIHDRTGKIWIHSLFTVIILSIIVIPLNWYVFAHDTIQFGLFLIAAIFLDFIMLFALVSLGYYILYAFKYGTSYISFSKFPFFLGDKMRVSFYPNRFSALNCTLRFVNEVFEKEDPSDDEKTIICYELYSEQKLIHTSPEIKNVLISFDIPEAGPVWHNQLNGTESIYYWELEIEAEQQGIDYSTSFLLPVYKRVKERGHIAVF